MVKAAQEPELKKAFTTLREETQGQIERLEQVFEIIGKRPQAKACEAINGIVAEGEETIEDFGESAAIDTGLVAAGQAVEHYEMARYGELALHGPISSAYPRQPRSSTKPCKRK